MADTEPTPEDLTPEDKRNAGEVGSAAVTAAQKGISEGASKDDVRRMVDEAVDGKIKSLQITMSDTDKDDIVDKMINSLDGMGAFDQPPTSGDAPAVTQDAGMPEAAAEAQAQTVAQEPPRKRSFAEKFAGI